MLNQQLIEINAIHSLHIQRLAAQQGNNFIPYKEAMEEAITARISREVGKNLTSNRRAKLLDDIAEIINGQFTAYNKELRKTNLETGVYEAGWQGKAIQTVYPTVEAVTVTQSAINQNAKNTLIKLGEGSYTSYNQMLNNFSRNEQEAINNIVARGFTSGMTTRDIANQVLDEVGGKLNGSRKKAMLVARNGTNHYANQARRTYFDKEDVVTGTTRIATLDSVTTSFCRGVDQTTVKKTDPGYDSAFAPFHGGCRTTNIPDVDARYKSDDEDGDRPENFRDAESGYLMPGTTSSNKIFYEAFKNLDAKTQDQQLGVTLGKAFRKGMKDGSLTPESFAKLTVSNIEQRGLTINEILQKDNALSRIIVEQNKGKNNYAGRLISKNQ